MLLRVEVSREIHLGLEGRDVVGFEHSALVAERKLRPSIWAGLLEAYQEAVLDHVCGPRRSPLSRGRIAPFTCPACGNERGFRRRGRRSRPRVLLTRLGRMELTLAQVACRCGRRFAPLLQLLGVERGSRVSPGLARRAAELATELPFARAAAQLLTETGHGVSTATVRRIVGRAGAHCDLTVPRDDLLDVPAMLIDGTRVPAGPRHGRRAHSARGVEVNIACAVLGRDITGRRPKAQIELVGAAVAEPWLSLHDAIRAPRAIGIVVTDGDNGIEGLLDRALPAVPRQHCTFHVQHNIRLRLWQDGVMFKDRDALTERLIAPPAVRALRERYPNSRMLGVLKPYVAGILDGSPWFDGLIEFDAKGKSAQGSLPVARRLREESIDLAHDHGFDYAAQHLRNVGRQLSTWKAVRHSRRPWRMNGRSRPEHTTSLLERTMREVNRRVDPPGNRWLVPGVRAMVNLLLARRFDHPSWNDLWQDAGTVRVWAGLRESTG